MSDVRVRDYLAYSKWLLVGWAAGLLVGWMLDRYFSFGNPVLEGLSRFIVGYGDTIGASLGMLVGRLRARRKSHAETFWLGTVLGTLVGPLVHFVMLRLGFSSAGVPGALIAVAYSNADNWGGVLSSFLSARPGNTLAGALAKLYQDKFVVANIAVLLLLLGLAIAIRLAGFAPTSYLSTAIEGAVLDNDSTLAVLLFYFWSRRA
ncbi:MAG: hypothetical protein KIT08_04560 [Anaerolineales bacterium]|nr:MAG: hypothetical protein KIT08_04560 [Anaerolineales bacterium]